MRSVDPSAELLTVEEAGSVKLPFGKHKGKSIREVSSTDGGLLYLDWLIGEEWMQEKFSDVADAVEVYLSDTRVASDLQDALMRRRGER